METPMPFIFCLRQPAPAAPPIVPPPPPTACIAPTFPEAPEAGGVKCGRRLTRAALCLTPFFRRDFRVWREQEPLRFRCRRLPAAGDVPTRPRLPEIWRLQWAG